MGGPTQTPRMNRRAIALLSGGLDSTLAVRVVLDQEIHVTAITFMTHFGCDGGSGGSCGHDVSDLAKALGFEIKLCHLGQEYIDMVKNPPHGRGKNMNPCIDCRIMMLRRAAEYMELSDASFLITGEVVDQRPMSQQMHTLRMIDKQVGLPGLILRPLSAKLLEPTLPELAGIVDRERLLDIRGRSRKLQMALAEKYGISEYAQPSGGCLLTDPSYSRKLKDLFDHKPAATANDILLVRVGRHFRLGLDGLLIVGRNEQENPRIQELAQPGDILLEADEHVGPLSLFRGPADADHLRQAGEITARYGKGKDQPSVRIRHRVVPLEKPAQQAGFASCWVESWQHLSVAPAEEGLLEALRVD